MAHKRKDSFVPCKEWCKHLRPEGKRSQAKAERRHAKRHITFDIDKVKYGSIGIDKQGRVWICVTLD